MFLLLCFACALRATVDLLLTPADESALGWHAVYPDGRVCISILHAPGDDPTGYESASERWLPVHTVRPTATRSAAAAAAPRARHAPAVWPSSPHGAAVSPHAYFHRAKRPKRTSTSRLCHSLVSGSLIAAAMLRAPPPPLRMPEPEPPRRQHLPALMHCKAKPTKTPTHKSTCRWRRSW